MQVKFPDLRKILAFSVFISLTLWEPNDYMVWQNCSMANPLKENT